jgi:hypothetical protein
MSDAMMNADGGLNTPDAAQPNPNAGNGYIGGEITPNLTDSSNGYVPDESVANITVSKLSKLQRWMLVRAFENHTVKIEGPQLLYGEVLAYYYGFCGPKDTWHRNQFMGHVFSPELIGRSRYNAACAAVSRTAWRLHTRGLVRTMRAKYGHWASIRLTDAGMAVAARLRAARPEARQ